MDTNQLALEEYNYDTLDEHFAPTDNEVFEENDCSQWLDDIRFVQEILEIYSFSDSSIDA